MFKDDRSDTQVHLADVQFLTIQIFVARNRALRK